MSTHHWSWKSNYNIISVFITQLPFFLRYGLTLLSNTSTWGYMSCKVTGTYVGKGACCSFCISVHLVISIATWSNMVFAPTRTSQPQLHSWQWLRKVSEILTAYCISAMLKDWNVYCVSKMTNQNIFCVSGACQTSRSTMCQHWISLQCFKHMQVNEWKWR